MAQSLTLRERVTELLLDYTTVSSTQVALACGISRQMAHRHLSERVATGELALQGQRRSARYGFAQARLGDYPLDGLNENDVWQSEKRGLEPLGLRPSEQPQLFAVLNFAVTEMVNNAIEHSEGSHLRLRWFVDEEYVSFEVADDGRGAFATLGEALYVDDTFEALVHLTKGKLTSAQSHHSGLGIFLTSRLVDRFRISANSLTWTRDAHRGDEAIGESSVAQGTVVRCDVLRSTTATLNSVTETVTNPTTGHLEATTIRLSLLEVQGFISRSDAQVVGKFLYGFRRVTLDFSDIVEVGQGFVDELFRVWARENPEIRLETINVSPVVSRVIALATG